MQTLAIPLGVTCRNVLLNELRLKLSRIFSFITYYNLDIARATL